MNHPARIAKWVAARSRSLRARRRVFLSAFLASSNRSCKTISKRASASSCAVASMLCAKPTRMAMRRAAGNRRSAVTLAVVAKRARDAILVGGICAACGSAMPSSRIDSNRSMARVSARELIRNVPERSRSSNDTRLPAGVTSRFSSCVRCAAVMPQPKTRHKRSHLEDIHNRPCFAPQQCSWVDGRPLTAAGAGSVSC
jgi:hypothetical protein